MSKALADIKNYYFPSTGTASTYKKPVGSDAVQKNLSYYISPAQFARIRHDILLWRKAVEEAELAYYPQRVKMQRMFQDTVLNEHVDACITKRKDLTLSRKFKLCDDLGNEDEALTKVFKKEWFRNFQSYGLESPLFGYTLVTLGDIINNEFPQLNIVRRQNISPDRYNVTSMIYSLSGQDFRELPYSDWHIYIPTPSDLGVSPCGYGLLYKIAKTEIYLRNNTGYNADFNEMYNQPLRKGKTTKTNEDERGAFEAALRNMGQNAYILLDDGQDEVDFVESSSVGTAFQSYADFEKRMEQKISKVLLGHADAMDSTPGKLGSEQGDDNPIKQALDNLQSKDGEMMQNVINNELLPRMRKHGFLIGLDRHFEYLNDQEEEEFRQREDKSNKTTAEIAQTMKNAGLQMDSKYFEKRTGIPTTPIAEKTPPIVPLGKEKENESGGG